MQKYRKYWREMTIGASSAMLIFLAYLQVNVWPVLFAAAAMSLIFVAAKLRGGQADVKGIVQTGRFKIKRDRSLVPKISFDDIGGQDRAKRELKEALEFLMRPEDIQHFGIRPLKGVLLTGPPGTGKTLMAKASAHYADAVFIGANGSDFVEMYVGVGAGRVRQLFQDARQQALREKKTHAIVFIDEIDVIGGKRQGGQQKEYDQTLNQLLTEMDGLYQAQPRILVMAATNRKEILDPALLRPGRFDRHVQVDLPDRAAREHILSIHAQNKPIANKAPLIEMIARETYGFSGAQLENVLNEAAVYAMRADNAFIQEEHAAMAIDKVMMGEQLDRETNEEERRRVAIHELGHAIMAEVARPGSVSQVSLRPRGQALGYVRHQPQQERYLYTRSFLEDQIKISLAGAAAEELFYGQRSTGSQGDFEQALQLVDTMVNAGLTDLGIVKTDQVPTEMLMKERTRILDELFAQTRAALENEKDIFSLVLMPLIDTEQLPGKAIRCHLRDS